MHRFANQKQPASKQQATANSTLQHIATNLVATTLKGRAT
jgi:hypothetical protein